MRCFLFLFVLMVCGWFNMCAHKSVDGKSLTILNRQDGDAPGYSRVNINDYPQLPRKVSKMAQYSTGVAVAFVTDSRHISARWKCCYPSEAQNTTPLMQSGLDLYIMRDSSWIHAGVGLPSRECSDVTLVENMDGTMHECLLYLPLFNKVDSLTIIVDDNAGIMPLCREYFNRKLVFVGSSITHGVSASRPGLAFPARIGRALGAGTVNLGFSGLCKLDAFYADMISRSGADAVIIDAFSNPSPRLIEQRLENFVDRITAENPGIPIVFLQTVVRETGNFDLSKRQFEADKRSAADSIMNALIASGKYDNLYYINPGMPLGTDHERTVDGTHPTDAGFELIVNNILKYIQLILNHENCNPCIVHDGLVGLPCQGQD